MPRDVAPADIIALADARAEARRARDWATADRLLADIAAAGWKVVDSGTMYDLVRSAAPDIADGGIVRHGSSVSVPSRLAEAPVGVATVVLVATDWPADLARALRALVERSPDGTQLVVVANAPSEAQASALESLDAVDPGASGVTTEVVWTSARLGWAAALNAGIRRAAAPVVVVLDTSVEPAGDLVGSLVPVLEDETVAVAGPFGLVSEDLRRFEAAPDDADEVVAIEGYAMAFRRADYAARGPLDEHFVFYRNLDIWWSLVLRDPGEDADGEARPRRALRVPMTGLIRHVHRGWASLPDVDRDRMSRKNFYRVLKSFATRRDLLPVGNTEPRGN
jgi:cysteinyl-tRNA synthetase